MHEQLDFPTYLCNKNISSLTTTKHNPHVQNVQTELKTFLQTLTKTLQRDKHAKTFFFTFFFSSWILLRMYCWQIQQIKKYLKRTL